MHNQVLRNLKFTVYIQYTRECEQGSTSINKLEKMADTDTNTRPRTELKKRFDFMFKIVLLGDTVSFTKIARGSFLKKKTSVFF